MFASARRAYETGTKAAPSGRQLEAAALFKSARQLETCRLDWSSPSRPQLLQDALRYNQRLWTFFQGEWMGTDCPLPPALRSNLLRLSAFVDKRTLEILAQPTATSLTALIEVNRQIAAGLSTPVESGEAQDRAA